MAKKKATPKKKNTANKSSAKDKSASKAGKTKTNLKPKSKSKKTSKKTFKSPEQNHRSLFPVVGIGASAGGLEALDELLDHLPTDTGMAFVIVTHQHRGHRSLLPELLAKHTEMPVAEATDRIVVQPNHVYIGPPSVNLALLNGSLHVMEGADVPATRVPLPIDYFFRSLAADRRERAICIVLSGTGTDGTSGLKAIKGESGMAMVQQPQSAKYAGMPTSAMATGLVDYVLPVTELPAQLIAYCKGPYLSGGAPAKVFSLPTEPLQKIYLLLRSRTGHDFSAYKSSTICRRIERRMNVHQIDDSAQYVRFLQDRPHEVDLLFKELLISVTNFFRDSDAFAALADEPFSKLIESTKEGESIRGWVPGCATGEEVYGLAILLREVMERLGKHHEVQIFGTDLDRDAIETARVGIYPNGIGVDVSAQRLDRFFVREDDSYRICKEIREMAVFAIQNVIKDPPFTKLDFLSCRNLLIYLNAELQKLLMPIFHYAIKSDGLLFLGPSETIGQFENLFEPIDKKWKIFRRKHNTPDGYSIPEIPALPYLSDVNLNFDEANVASASHMQKRVSVSTMIERQLLDQFCPASVVVNDRGDIIHVHGRTGEYLELADGQARTNVLDMARKGLTHELGSSLRKIAAGAKEVTRESLRVKTNGGYSLVKLNVKRIENPEAIRGLLLITFEKVTSSVLGSASNDRPIRDSANPTASQAGANVAAMSTSKLSTKSQSKANVKAGSSSEADVDDSQQSEHEQILESMERELQYMRESNQATLEEVETSNEELKSANEELQSLNEELTTINFELQSKVDKLAQANDDMQNLLNSTDIATIFLDDELNIKRFTEQARK